MRLLVFRCENPENLISLTGDSHDCTVENVFGTSIESPEALREHSVWYHVNYLVRSTDTNSTDFQSVCVLLGLRLHPDRDHGRQ